MGQHPILSKKGVIDDKIYTKNRAMRLLNQSKLGKTSKLKNVTYTFKYEGDLVETDECSLGTTCIYNCKVPDESFFKHDCNH